MNTKLSPQRIAIYSIVGVLAIIALVLFGSSSYNLARTSTVPPKAASSDNGDAVHTADTVTQRAVEQPFDVAVLSLPRYQSIDKTLIQTGRLPVSPPSPRGKLNLFSL